MSSVTYQQSQTFGAHPHADGVDHEHSHDAGGNTVFGFWIYLMSDCLLFACLFAGFAVLGRNTAGGPSAKELFDLKYVAVETGALLLSSITYGMAMIGSLKRNSTKVLLWLAITALFGLVFIGMEVNEFHHLIEEGNGPNRSAFLSAFFSLVGTHGIHVTSGLIWLAVLMYQVLTKGVTDTNRTRLMCLSLFWHFLDIVWICVFTVVYLMGVL
ncbi:MAG TPA: cytochrome o ubiquinol oxidase subunit III [Burkholderiaceae bacterium]